MFDLLEDIEMFFEEYGVAIVMIAVVTIGTLVSWLSN